MTSSVPSDPATSLATQSSPSVADEAHRVLVVPVGATEQHGPHLPLTTDTDIARALADRLAVAMPTAVVVAPSVAYGSSGEHRGFAGSLSIGQASVESLLVELVRSATCTWPRVLLLVTHGGNAEPLARAMRTLRCEEHDVRSWVPTWRGDAHAGHTETSIMLAVAPDRVALERAECGTVTPITELFDTLRGDGVIGVSSNGILGDATTASAAAGAELLRDATLELTDLICRWLEDPP